MHLSYQTPSSNNTRKDPTHEHHEMVETEIRLINWTELIFFAAKDGEALFSQQKQDRELTVAWIMNSLLPNSHWNWRKWRKALDHSGILLLDQSEDWGFVSLRGRLRFWASLVAQRLKRLPPMRETRVQSLGWEDPLEKEMVTHSIIPAWRIPWMEKPGRLQSTGLQEPDSTEQLHLHSGMT